MSTRLAKVFPTLLAALAILLLSLLTRRVVLNGFTSPYDLLALTASLGIVGALAYLLRTRARLRATFDAQSETEKTLRSILNSVADMYFSLDAEGHFLEVNPPAEDYFGKPASELIGKVIWDVFPAVKSAVYFHQYFL